MAIRMRKVCTIAALAALQLASGWASAASAVEAYAKLAAESANKHFQTNPPNDGVTRSSKAYSRGGSIVYEYVLGIRADATEKELAAWRSGTRGEIISGVCTAMKKDEFFQKKGLSMAYRYLDQQGKLLDEFTVNKPACAAYGL